MQHNAENAKQVNLLAIDAAEIASQDGVVVRQVVSIMNDIKDLIHELVDKVADGSKLAFQAGCTMEEILKSIHSVTDRMTQPNKMPPWLNKPLPNRSKDSR